MRSLRTRLFLIFLAATLPPLAATAWVVASLVEHSLDYSQPRQLAALSQTLERVGREYYHQARQALEKDAAAGRLTPRLWRTAERRNWPPEVAGFAGSGEAARFVRAGQAEDRIELYQRTPAGVAVYSRPLGGIAMEQVAAEIRAAREAADRAATRDLRRGFFLTGLLLTSAIWLTSLLLLFFLADRTTRPIRQLTAALGVLAGGDLSVRIPETRDDEAGAAIRAFNGMAAQLEEGRRRLIYLTQVASWQQLARKMAHEVKNSLTPIRLNVEEMVARAGLADREFLAQAAAIIGEEIQGLERRVRAFSELGAEPPVTLLEIDLNGAVEERIALLRQAHPEVAYQLKLDAAAPRATADADLLRGILTNLLENAAQAAGTGGTVLVRTAGENGMALVEIHDSGPGLSPAARATAFEPAISFKQSGMGLGLSIARKSALRLGGDIVLLEGLLGGAAFRVTLPPAPGVM